MSIESEFVKLLIVAGVALLNRIMLMTFGVLCFRCALRTVVMLARRLIGERALRRKFGHGLKEVSCSAPLAGPSLVFAFCSVCSMCKRARHADGCRTTARAFSTKSSDSRDSGHSFVQSKVVVFESIRAAEFVCAYPSLPLSLH